MKLHSRSTVRRGEENACAHSWAALTRIRILLTYFSYFSIARARVEPQKGTLMTFLFIPAVAEAARKNSFVSRASPSNSADCIPRGARKHEGRSADCFFTTMLSNREENFCLATTSFLRHRARFEKLPSTDTNTYKWNFIADLTIVPVPAVCHAMS